MIEVTVKSRQETMRKFHTDITIEAPIEHVWNVLSDVRRWPEWTKSVSLVDFLDGMPHLTGGSRVRIHQPKLWAAVWTVTQWHPPCRFAWITHRPGLVVFAEHSLSQTPTGCTLTLTLQFNGLIGGLVGFLGRNLTNDYLGLEARGLKARSEDQA